MSGFSGSPVFVVVTSYIKNEPEDNRAVVVTVTGAPCYMLGIDWGHHPWEERVRDRDGNPARDHSYIRTNSGMMMVVPAQKLMSLLDSPGVAQLRRDIETREGDRIRA